MDYAIQCPKCKKLIGVRRYTGVEQTSVCFRTASGEAIAFVEVLNHRVLIEKDETYIATLPIFEGVIDDQAAGVAPPAVIRHILTLHH